MTLKLSNLPSFLLCLVYSIASTTRSVNKRTCHYLLLYLRYNCSFSVMIQSLFVLLYVPPWFLQRSWVLWPLLCDGLCFTTLWGGSRPSSAAGSYVTTVCGTNWSSTGFRSVAHHFSDLKSGQQEATPLASKTSLVVGQHWRRWTLPLTLLITSAKCFPHDVYALSH